MSETETVDPWLSDEEELIQPEGLLPCPFCGRAAQAFFSWGAFRRLVKVGCRHDECFEPQATAGTVNEAAARWNKRAPTEQTSR